QSIARYNAIEQVYDWQHYIVREEPNTKVHYFEFNPIDTKLTESNLSKSSEKMRLAILRIAAHFLRYRYFNRLDR
ncbi:MAG: hypothetical protein AAFR37_05065, partial [Cyanobacteria bacterium J06628_3]